MIVCESGPWITSVFYSCWQILIVLCSSWPIQLHNIFWTKETWRNVWETGQYYTLLLQILTVVACNSLLFSLLSYQLAHIQSVLNAAAGIIYDGKRSDDVTPLLHNCLHWLWVRERVRFKLCHMVFKALSHLAPEYIMNCCVLVSNTARRAQ